ncbi:MAG: citryl-CoA lyase [Candidatus Woesebacteria bacterium]|nr:MAG: citryl-CoA lyase [Candidatus Woesebacteria bacterium]
MAKTIQHKNDLPYFGEESLLETAPERSFSQMIFELLSGKAPDIHQGKVFETILNISIDHGEETPSATETIRAAKEGKTISESVASGILQINDTHGGAIEPAMGLLYKIKNQKLNIKNLVQEQLRQGNRIPGFGHRIYEVDPRSQLLFKLAKDEGISDEYINLAQEIARELLEQKGKVLPVNIDGAIAAILCAFGWDPKPGKAVFVIARTPGLCGQYLNNCLTS